MEKIKLAIVDDELTSRNTIKQYLVNNDVYEVVADFQNGKSALEWLRENTVDILLCDMQMPEMNGVELMRSIHIIDEYLPVIVISGFDNFDYVRGSLVNGAANYLLKHELNYEYLIRTLDHVREQYRIVPKGKQIYRKKGYCIYDKNEFRADEIRRLTQEEQIAFCCQNVACLAVGPDYKLRDGINILEYKQDINKAVLDIVSQILGEHCPYIVYVTREYQLLILLAFEKEKSTLFMLNTISNLATRLQRQSIRMLDTMLSIVCSDVYNDVAEAIECAEHILQILEDRFYLGENRIVHSSVAKQLQYSDCELPQKYWDQLEFEMSNQMLSMSDALRDIFSCMEKERITKKRVLQSCDRILLLAEKYHLLTESERREEHIKIVNSGTFVRIQERMQEMLYKKAHIFEREEKRSFSPYVSHAVDYINRNYKTDISLENCAEAAGCGYTYLSKEFKRETGMRFVEYLNRQRINYAKSLLIRNEISIKEIVEASGFRNYNYFFRVFKEIEGVTPSEFLTKK